MNVGGHTANIISPSETIYGYPVNPVSNVLPSNLQHGANPIGPGVCGCNNGYAHRQGYLYDMYYYICEESSSWWKILLWIFLGLLLAALIIGGIVALALIPVYLNRNKNTGFYFYFLTL